MRRWTLFLLAVGICLAACTTSGGAGASGTTGTSVRCTPGSETPCTCDGGGAGTQFCRSGGVLEACVCVGTTSGGSSTGGGTTGGTTGSVGSTGIAASGTSTAGGSSGSGSSSGTGSTGGTGTNGGTGATDGGPSLAPPVCGLTNDTTNHIPDPVAWASFTPPAVGQTFVDQVYGCNVTRLTDSASHGSAVRHWWSAESPMNLDDTMIFVNDTTKAWFVIDLAGNVVVPASAMAGSGVALWDRRSASTFWRASGNELQRCTIASGAATCVTAHTFSEYPYAASLSADWSDMTADGWIAMLGQATQNGTMDVFAYNPYTSVKSTVYTTTCTGDVALAGKPCMYGILTTPSGGIAVEFSQAGAGTDNGWGLWEAPWKVPMALIESRTNHLAVGRDLTGNEVFPADADGDAPTACDFSPSVDGLSGSTPSCLFTTAPPLAGWDVGYSDWAASAWVVFSAQGDNSAELFGNDPNYAPPSAANWGPYDGEVVVARVDADLDPTKVYRLTLSHTRNQSAASNASDPRAALSWDGKYLVFDSNAAWGATGCGSLTYCTDVYLIQLH
jgi:hypothetical protein